METAVKAKKVTAKNSEFVSRKDGYTINPKNIIVIWEENERDDYGTPEDFEAFKENIKQNGVLQNIKCFIDENGDWHLDHGFRRMKAILELADEGHVIEKVSFDPVTKNEEETLVRHFTLNSGKNLTDLEAAKALKKLQILMCTDNINDVAKRVSLPYVKVYNLIKFESEAGSAIKNAVGEGEMKFTVAQNIVKHNKSVKDQIDTLEKSRENAKEAGKKTITSKHVSPKKDVQLAFDITLNIVLHEASKLENADKDLINLVETVMKAIKAGDPVESLTTYFTL